jgi:hypothetical protein
MRVLVVPSNGGGPSQAGPGLIRRNDVPSRVKVSLVLADLLLVGTTVLWAHGMHHMGWREAAVCVVAVLFAAWLTCLAAWLHWKK